MADKLTTMLLKAFTPSDVGLMLVDVEGLRGIVKPDKGGSIYFYFEFRYRKGSKHRTVGVGDTRTITLAQIRAEHRRLKLELMKGNDPAEARRTAKLANQVDIPRQAGTHRAELQRLTGV